MVILLLFAFLAGIVTILSPCILPVLPIVLSGSIIEGKRRPFGIVTGFVFSFTFFTLFLSTLVRFTGLPADFLRTVAIAVIAIFGLSMLIPALQAWLERAFSRLANAYPQRPAESGFTSGFFMGLSLGLVWAPCVGPILASIIALAITGTVNGSTFAITLSYAIGTAIPMFAVLYGGRALIQKLPNLAAIQKIFGVVMILVAFAMYFNLDRTFQTYILTAFPNYGSGLTKIETIPIVEQALKTLNAKPQTKNGTPMFDVLNSGAERAPELTGGQEWFNSKPLTLAELKGKVVMVDFWTYTCINCIRTLPYTKAWYDKYKDKGFVLIGVHTPEFAFEKEAANVEKAIKDFGIPYPVVQDNDYAIWNAYQNQYWPAHYLIDKTGKIVDTHFGEGDYDETERNIQKLLDVSMPVDNPVYDVATQTPETYLGERRGDYSSITTTGSWNKTDEYAQPAAGSTLTFPFDAMSVYLVMAPKQKSGMVDVYLDGKFVSTITVDSDRLYDLIKLPNQGAHTLQLKFLDSNLQLYAFTFG